MAIKQKVATRASSNKKAPAKKKSAEGTRFFIIFFVLVLVILAALFLLNLGRIKDTLLTSGIHTIANKYWGIDLPGKEEDTSTKKEDKVTIPLVNTNPSSGQTNSTSIDPHDYLGSGDAPVDATKQPESVITEPGQIQPQNFAKPANANPQATIVITNPEATPTQNKTSSTPTTATNQINQNNPKTATQQSTQAAPQKLRKVTVYLVSTSDARQLTVSRELPATKSPLTDALSELLKGPTTSEAQKGYRSLIPKGTKLLWASIDKNIALLNFSSEFLYNPFSMEGYRAQLKQIIYTATSFPSVKGVQILVEGKRIQYLGENLYIGTTLTRDSF